MLAPVVATPVAGTAVGIAEREWRLSAYRSSARRGRVTLHIHNFGEDPHDVAVRGPGGYRSSSSPIIGPGENGVLRVRLNRPGTYTLLCTLPGHASKGMRATIRIR
jgi:hypothetical protein